MEDYSVGEQNILIIALFINMTEQTTPVQHFFFFY